MRIILFGQYLSAYVIPVTCMFPLHSTRACRPLSAAMWRLSVSSGGVPQTVKIDNLKAAIVETDFYEPTVQRTYAAFADYYGFLPNPCRVYPPTDKGKVESNVKYS